MTQGLKTIMIDAGHGGTNPGNITTDGLMIEKHVTLDLALRLEQSLAGTPAAIVLTRDDDSSIPNDTRGELSTKYDADLVLCIHTNSWAATAHGGLMLFYPGNKRMEALSEVIADVYPQRLRPCQVRPAYPEQYADAHYLLSQHRCDAIVVETAFASNDSDRKMLETPWGREQIVSALRQGVAWWLDQNL